MDTLESLKKIRPVWISRLSYRLARGEGVRQSFQAQLDSLFDLIVQSIESGDPAWLDSILNEWIDARTETDIESQGNSLSPILEQILLSSYEILCEALEEDEALRLLGALLPIYTYALAYTKQRETQQYITRISAQLEEAKLALERLDKSKSDFIAVAAHELKTPLTLIEGYTTMLREQLANPSEAIQVKTLLNGIEQGTRRLRQIVDDMIDVSMIDNQMLTLNYQPLWIGRLLDGIQYEFNKIVNERRLNLIIHPFPGSQEMTFGDPERLYQALRNVVSNAVKFTPDGGRISINGRMLPGFIEITVSDSGIGIDPEDQMRIFEKFGRLGDTSLHSSGRTKFKGGGPGLGLPIAKGIIEAHGGAIWVESEGYDEERCPGSTFHILLPIRKEPPDEKMAKIFRESVESGQLKGLYTIYGEETS